MGTKSHGNEDLGLAGYPWYPWLLLSQSGSFLEGGWQPGKCVSGEALRSGLAFVCCPPGPVSRHSRSGPTGKDPGLESSVWQGGHGFWHGFKVAHGQNL